MPRKLALHRETLRTLGSKDLEAVAAGGSEACATGDPATLSTQALCPGGPTNGHTDSATSSITRLSQPTGPKTCHVSATGGS